MSQENVEVVRRLFAALKRVELEALLQLFDPDVEWSTTEGTFHGIEGVGTHWSEWIELWEEHRVEPEEFTECDRGVLVTVHLTGRGAGSGMKIDQRFFQVYTVHEGKISRMVEFVDRSRALEEAGLRE